MPPVMPYVSTLTGDASFYPPLRKKGRDERSVNTHRLIVAPSNSIDDVLRVATENLPLEADNLATAIHKIAKLRRIGDVSHDTVINDPRWSRLLDEVVNNGTAFIWPMRLLSLVAWAVSSVRDRRIVPLLFAVASKRCSVGAVPQDLSSIAWAVATSRMRDQAAQTLLSRISEESQSKVKEFVPQDIAMCAWAFAKVACRDNKLLRLFADESVERLPELNGQNISNVVWSLATIREMHEPLMDIVSKTRADQIQGMGAQEFSNIVWSFATMPKVSEMLFRRTAPRVVQTARDLDSQHLANIAWAYAKISHRDDGLFYVLSREAMRGQRQVNPLNLANLAWAFASAGWHGEMSTRRIGLRDPEFFQWIANTTCGLLKRFTPQNCSNLVWAFATNREPNDEMFQAMGEHVQEWIQHEDFDPQHLSNVLWSYAKLVVRDQALFECAGEAIVRRGVDYLARTSQNVSNVVWAYGAVAVRPPALLEVMADHIAGKGNFVQRLVEVRPLLKSCRAQLAMTVLSLHRLGLDNACWTLFERIRAEGVLAGGEAYSNWLFVCGQTQDMRREVDVWEQMARSAGTRGLQAAVWNCMVIRCLKMGDTARARAALEEMEREGLLNQMSELLRPRTGAPPPRGRVGDIEWRRREKEEHEWVTNSLGFSLRLNKIEYYKEVGTCHYILKHGERENVPVIHTAIESFIREQELWLKLAGDEKGAVLDAVIEAHGRPRLVVEVGLYVGYSSTRMASKLKQWGGKVISMEVDPYHAAISRNTIELAGLADYIEIWVGHSENLIPRLKERLPEHSIDILFFDQQGTKMHLDLDRIMGLNMLSDTAIIVGDNVLRPGSPQFMYWTCVDGPWDTQIVSLKEYRQDVVEDWMSISYYLPHSPRRNDSVVIPEMVEQLAHKTDGIRWQSVESKVTDEQWDNHSLWMRREFAAVGIRPYEIIPYQDVSGKTVIKLRPPNR
eukprot:TRINITY_DN15662_c0_g1_i1.p1 TRINITY_DN15662_c0_g1~~TRINITY_DN15662_c0_g1_i1.p1  ORF type:complete len:957 (-),score=169.88 TRINITY_DN15662_c0_g1_i1:202-3072(-)